MKTKEELIRRYRALYSRMKDGDNPRYMRIFGEAEGAMFASLAASSPETAEKWLSKLEAMDWDNYLAKDEADMITSRMVSQDGSKGPHWTYDTFVSAVRSLGMEPEDRPHYNSYALWTAANMIYSDHARSIAEDMGYKNAAEAFVLDPFGEKVEYLAGYIGRAMFPVAKRFLCEHCRKELDK